MLTEKIDAEGCWSQEQSGKLFPVNEAAEFTRARLVKLCTIKTNKHRTAKFIHSMMQSLTIDKRKGGQDILRQNIHIME